jgi:hypothetical protein
MTSTSTRVKPLLSAVLNNESDEFIWDKVYSAVTESAPPPRPLSSFQQTSWLRNTSSFANSFEHCKYVDDGMTSSPVGSSRDLCSCDIALPKGYTEAQERDHARHVRDNRISGTEKEEIAGGKSADGDIM